MRGIFIRYLGSFGYCRRMSSKKENRDAVFAKRAGAAAAANKNHTHLASTKGIRQSGNHSEVIRQGNPGRTNRTAQKGK